MFTPKALQLIFCRHSQPRSDSVVPVCLYFQHTHQDSKESTAVAAVLLLRSCKKMEGGEKVVGRRSLHFECIIECKAKYFIEFE